MMRFSAENEDNPDFWWLYAHAVEDEEAGQEALNHVRQLQPDYPGVDNLAQKAGISTPRPSQTLRPPPQSLPDLPTQDSASGAGDFDTDKPANGSSRRNLIVLVAITIVLVILAVLFIPNLLNNDEETSTPTSSAIVVQPTEIPIQATAEVIDATESVEPTDNDADATEVVDPTNDLTEIAESDGDYAALAAQVSQFDVPDEGVEVGETLLGNTLLISTCSPPGPVATQSILGVITVLKDELIGDEIEALGFRVINCTDDTISRIIGISRDDFDDFVSDTITTQELQGLLRPIG
ncbi:MAG: hypothetical protein Q9P01_05185 [Anaerolineae bacterium]|nr:hypothetical protein [Anaerolineae bacterium]